MKSTGRSSADRSRTTAARTAASSRFVGNNTMKPIETNIFPFSSVGGLNATYEIVAVDGLASDHDEYHENCHRLQRRATRACGAGAITLHRVGGPVLAVPAGHAGKLPASMILTRAKVTFRPTSERLRVDFNAL